MSAPQKSTAKLSKVAIEPPGSLENLDKEKSTELESGLEPVLEVTEVEPSEIFEIPIEFGEFDEIPPRIIAQKTLIDDYFSIEAQYNVIYELGIVNLCWPVIEDPVFEPRTCFPPSYYTNTKKERLLLAYAESFRRQYHFLYGKDAIPILLDAPNECGMPKMVCTTIRPTKLSYTGTNTWEGLSSLVADYFEYEPLLKPMLHPDRIMSPVTCIVRRKANPFELATVLVSWLIGATYDAYIVVGNAVRDVCLGIRYRTECPDIPDESEKVEEEEKPDEAARYKLMPLPDLNSKYVAMMERKEVEKIEEIQRKKDVKRQMKIEELELPPPDDIDGFRMHAWVLVISGPGVEEPFFIEPSEGNPYEMGVDRYQKIHSIYNHENYYVNLQKLTDPAPEEEAIPEEEEQKAEEEEDFMMPEPELVRSAGQVSGDDEGGEDAAPKEVAVAKPTAAAPAPPPEPEVPVKKKHRDQETPEDRLERKERHRIRREEEEAEAAEAEALGLEKKEKKKKKRKKADDSDLKLNEPPPEVKEKSKSEMFILRKDKDYGVEEEEPILEEEEIPIRHLDTMSYNLGKVKFWEHLLVGEPFSRRLLIGIDNTDYKTAIDTEKHLDVPNSWVEKLELTSQEFRQRYPGSYKRIQYKKVVLEKFSPYAQRDGIVKRIKIFDDYAQERPLVTHEYYQHRMDKMFYVRIDHVQQQIVENFNLGRRDNLIKHTYAMDSPPCSIEAHRTLEFFYYARLDHLTKIVCTPLTFDEHFTDRLDRLETRTIVYTEGTKSEPKRQLLIVTETYSRNPDVHATKDVWKRIFMIPECIIQMLYHYDYNFVTNYTRNYDKPNLAETGGKIPYNPEKTTGYIADPLAKQPRPIDVYNGLVHNMEWEENSLKLIRDRESDITDYLRLRHRELTEPILVIALFDTDKNEEALKAWRLQQLLLAQMAARETEAEIDPLAPYLARMFGSGQGAGIPLSLKEATLLREQCVNDFKAKQLQRQIQVQKLYEELNSEYKNKRLWYLANQFVLTPEKESAYFAQSAELSFRVHTAEVRLTRSKDLSGPRFRVLLDCLERHPALKDFNKVKNTQMTYNRYSYKLKE